MPRFEIAPWLCYACTGCGLCCRQGFNIWCHPDDKKRLETVPWQNLLPSLADKRIFLRTRQGYRFALEPDGACCFLLPDRRCLIHAELGYRAKVLTCKMYPINLVHSGDRIYAGLLFSCPAVIDAQGPSLQSQQSLLHDLADEMDRLFPPPPPADSVALLPGQRISLRELSYCEEALLAILDNADLPFCRRLLWAGDLLDRLEEKAEGGLPSHHFYQWLADLVARSGDEAANCGLRRPRLGLAERILLREAQGMCSSLALKVLSAGSLLARTQARLRRLALACRYIWGNGNLPGEEGGIAFAAAEAVDAMHLSSDAESLLARYLRTKIASRAYFGREAWGLSVVAGCRAILTLPSLMMWHAKVRAARTGRQAVLYEDVREAVLLVERSVGHMSNLSGRAVRSSLQIIFRRSWPQRAFLHTVLP